MWLLVWGLGAVALAAWIVFGGFVYLEGKKRG